MILMIPIVLSILFIPISGCNSGSDPNKNGSEDVNDSKPGIEGYVTKKEDGRILVVDPESQDFSSTGGADEFYNAIWFSDAPKEIEVGEKVQVWFEAVDTSYPGQSKAVRVSVIPTEIPDDTDLTEPEVIRSALASKELEPGKITVVRAVGYDKTSDVWHVQLIQEGKEWNLQFHDAKTDPTHPQENAGEIPEVPVEQLTIEFEKRLYQEVDEETGKVLKFKTKAEWVEHMSEVMDEQMAQTYADEYYTEQDGELYLIPRGGPAMFLLDQPYEMKKVGERKAQAIQKSEDIMYGKYELIIAFEYRDSRWIILNQEFNSLE